MKVSAAKDAEAAIEDTQAEKPDEVLEDRKQIEADIRAALWGYAIYDIASDVAPGLKFGSVNDRPVDSAHARELADSMSREDVRRFSRDTAIPVCIARKDLSISKQSKEILENPNGYPQLKDVFLGKGRVEALGGQHRKAAVTILTSQADTWLNHTAKQRLSQALADEALVKQALGQSKASNASTLTISDTERELLDAQSRTATVKKQIQDYTTLKELRGLWLIAIYCDGEAIPTQVNRLVH